MSRLVIHSEKRTRGLVDKLRSIQLKYDTEYIDKLTFFHDVDRLCFNYLENKNIICGDDEKK